MIGHELNNLTEISNSLKQVYKSVLKTGDVIVIKTANSNYRVEIAPDLSYIVSGGWFDKNNLSPSRVKINGCTWGGNIIKSNIIAACGLRLEFQNRVLTSTIKKIFYIPHFHRN